MAWLHTFVLEFLRTKIFLGPGGRGRVERGFNSAFDAVRAVTAFMWAVTVAVRAAKASTWAIASSVWAVVDVV